MKIFCIAIMFSGYFYCSLWTIVNEYLTHGFSIAYIIVGVVCCGQNHNIVAGIKPHSNERA